MANIELDGANKKIKVDSGDLTLDVPGDIVLDADGGDIVVADGGTNILKVTNSSSDVVLQPQVDAKDIIFKQYDGTTVATVEDNGTFNIPTDKLAINGTAVTSTAAELNILDGVTSTAAELNILDGVTATASELNIMDGVTATTAELNIMDGVTSTAAELNILDGVTATASELNLLDGGTSVGSSITVADADGFIVNDGGTMKTIPATDISTYVGGGLWVKLGDTSYSGNTSSITFDNVFSSTYRVYKVFMKTATSNSDEQVKIRFRSGSSGSNADISDSHYTYKRNYSGIDLDDGNSANGNSNGRLASYCELASQGHMGSNHKPMTIDMTIQDPGDHASDNSGRTQILYNADFYNNANLSYNEVGSCFYNYGTDPTGITFEMTAGSYGYGNILLYGLKP